MGIIIKPIVTEKLTAQGGKIKTVIQNIIDAIFK